LRTRTKTHPQLPRPLGTVPAPSQSPPRNALGTVFSQHRPGCFPSVLHCFLPRHGFRAGETAPAGASLPFGCSHPCARPAGSGGEEGIPRRLPLPEGVGEVAPAALPAPARAPVGISFARGARGGWGYSGTLGSFRLASAPPWTHVCLKRGRLLERRGHARQAEKGSRRAAPVLPPTLKNSALEFYS
jgi:hypothetical protein